MRETKEAGHSASQEVVVAHLDSIVSLRRWGWLLASIFALACVSKQVPIGAQTGGGGAGGTAGTAGGAPGAGGVGTAGTGAGGAASAGGSPGAGGATTVVDASASGGASGADAASGGASGSDAASGTDAGSTIDAGSCSASFASALVKNCTTAADCVLDRHFDCCGNVITAIRAGTESTFTAAQQAFESCVPGCNVRGCDHADFAENQQSIVGTTNEAFAAECVNGRCTSIVTTGSNCTTDANCGAGEICVAFVTNLGPTSTTTMSCRGNSCGASALSCTCAGTICTGFYSGICTVNAARLTCDDGKQ
jgi:hypothetical protein